MRRKPSQIKIFFSLGFIVQVHLQAGRSELFEASWCHAQDVISYIRNPDPLSRLIQVIRKKCLIKLRSSHLPVVSWSFSDRFVFIRGREVRVGKFFLCTTQYQGPGAARGKEIEEENKNQWRPRAIIVPLWLLVANDLIKFPQKSKVAPNLNSKSCQATRGWGYRWAQSDMLMSRLSGPIQKSAGGK